MRFRFSTFLIFLFVIVGLVGFWHYQKNTYSKEILKLEILGPSEASLAEEVEYLVKYKNQGNIRLDEPNLIFEYPDSRREVLGEEELGSSIYPGQEKIFSFKTRLFGKEKQVLIVKASLSYRPKNLKAGYESETNFTTVIKKVPITFEFDLPTKVGSGKEIRLRLNYFSNVDYPLADLRCQIDYPSDFEFLESSPKSLEKNEWEIGLLNKSEGGRLEVLGKIMGQVGEEKLFRAKLGIWLDDEFILLKEAIKGIEIIEPFLYLHQEINGNPEYAASPGDWLHYQIFFKNIGDEELANLFLVAKLEGLAFDFGTLRSDLGNYEPGDNSIIFDWRRVSKLQYLAPTEQGEIDFWIKLKDDWSISKNPMVRNKIFISQAKEEFITKINSKLELSQKGYFADEVFGNTGPLPPKVGQETTYTIIWQVRNYYNEVKDVKVKARLMDNVSLTGQIFPDEETTKFAFDSDSREIVWSVGDMSTGQGVLDSGPNIAFQIKFRPDEFQRGTIADLISQAKIIGQDVWTGKKLEIMAPGIKTDLPDDDSVSDGRVE